MATNNDIRIILVLSHVVGALPVILLRQYLTPAYYQRLSGFGQTFAAAFMLTASAEMAYDAVGLDFMDSIVGACGGLVFFLVFKFVESLLGQAAVMYALCVGVHCAIEGAMLSFASTQRMFLGIVLHNIPECAAMSTTLFSKMESHRVPLKDHTKGRESGPFKYRKFEAFIVLFLVLLSHLPQGEMASVVNQMRSTGQIKGDSIPAQWLGCGAGYLFAMCFLDLIPDAKNEMTTNLMTTGQWITLFLGAMVAVAGMCSVEF